MEANNTVKFLFFVLALVAMGLAINEVFKMVKGLEEQGKQDMSNFTTTVQPTSQASSSQPQCITRVDVLQDLPAPMDCKDLSPLELERLIGLACKDNNADCEACSQVLNTTKFRTPEGRLKKISCCERAIICNQVGKCNHGKLECFRNGRKEESCCKCDKGYGGETCDQCSETRTVACQCYESGFFSMPVCGDVYFNKENNCSTTHQHNGVNMTCVCDNTRPFVTRDPKVRTLPECSGEPVRPCEVPDTEKETRHSSDVQ